MKETQPVLKVGIIGLGHLHPRSYMPIFEAVDETKVVAVAESDVELRDAFCADFHVAGFSDVDALLAAQDIDIAALFLPHADCPAAAQRCAEAGVHLLVEKPMAASAEGAAAIVAAAAGNKVKLTTGYCWRLHPVAKEVKRLVQSGLLGDIVGGEGRCAAGRLHRYIDGHSPWMLEKSRSGGGPMYNLGVHWIDLFRWILEDDVSEVSGRNVKVNEQFDVEDNSFAHLRFGKGAILALDISYTVPDAFPYGRDLYIGLRGTRGVVSWAPAYEGERDILNVCSDDPRFTGGPCRSMEFELEPVKAYSGRMGIQYVAQFAQAILNDGDPDISGEDGVAALRVVEAVYRAAESRAWVEVQQ